MSFLAGNPILGGIGKAQDDTGGMAMFSEMRFSKENFSQEDILHIRVGDPAFETLEGKLRSCYAPDYAHRLGVNEKECGDFFVSCNLATGDVTVCATYYPPTNALGTVIYVPLQEAEKDRFIQAMEDHCQKHYKMDGIQILNSERKVVGLPPIKPRKPALCDRIADASQSLHSSLKDIGSSAEQKNLKER